MLKHTTRKYFPRLLGLTGSGNGCSVGAEGIGDEDVILSGAKNPFPHGQILRSAQNDTPSPWPRLQKRSDRILYARLHVGIETSDGFVLVPLFADDDQRREGGYPIRRAD